MHIDMNSYFASVEQQANPHFRGQPVGVCAYLSKNGCIIAASKEAKALGVGTGAIVQEAKKLIPQIKLVECDPVKYRHVTQGIFSIFRDYTQIVEPYSIDEAFLDLTGHIKNFRFAKKVAQEIKKRIKKEIGDWLTCSIGISFTRFLAKVASELQKPDGLTLVKPRHIPGLYKRLELTDVWGINFRMAARLNRLGILSLMDLYNYPETNILQILGRPGWYLWAKIRGEEIEEVDPDAQKLPKSIGHSYCLPVVTRDLDYLGKILMKLCEKTGRRLRASGRVANRIYVGWSYKYQYGDYLHRKTPKPIYDTMDIWQTAFGLLNTSIRSEVSMLAVTVTDLRPWSGQMEFWHNTIKQKNLTQALDKINDKFGEYSVYHGRMFGTQKNAPERVGFRKSVLIPEKDEDLKYIPEE
ncbi:DNA polymerase IV [Candidatus Saccharibacteria bacterium]|nr:DNA polymerase IV [Candidatus Saccharibacteria bacterium]